MITTIIIQPYNYPPLYNMHTILTSLARWCALRVCGAGSFLVLWGGLTRAECRARAAAKGGVRRRRAAAAVRAPSAAAPLLPLLTNAACTLCRAAWSSPYSENEDIPMSEWSMCDVRALFVNCNRKLNVFGHRHRSVDHEVFVCFCLLCRSGPAMSSFRFCNKIEVFEITVHCSGQGRGVEESNSSVGWKDGHGGGRLTLTDCLEVIVDWADRRFVVWIRVVDEASIWPPRRTLLTTVRRPWVLEGLKFVRSSQRIAQEFILSCDALFFFFALSNLLLKIK